MYGDISHTGDEFWRKMMRNSIYEWMKNLTLFYVLFQASMQLVPDKTYEKYIRFYMGLLMILLMLSPVFLLLGRNEEIWQDFGAFYEKEELKRMEKEAENLKEYYLLTEEKWNAMWEEQAEEGGEDFDE